MGRIPVRVLLTGRSFTTACTLYATLPDACAPPERATC